MIIIDCMNNFNNVYRSKNYVWHQTIHFHLETNLNTSTLFILNMHEIENMYYIDKILLAIKQRNLSRSIDG